MLAPRHDVGGTGRVIENNTITNWGNADIHLQNNDGSATVNAGIGVRKQGTVATTNDFGIVGIGGPAGTVQTNAQVQSFVGNPNNLTNDGGGGSVNGVDIISGSNYTSCTQT